ncbi:hypothetical protein ACR3K2_07850 [Cryptosporidium serpentis]
MEKYEEGWVSVTAFFFLSNVVRVTFVSYFFWSGAVLLAGAIISHELFIHYSPFINGNVACSAKYNFYVILYIWIIEGLIFILACISYSVIETRNLSFDNLSFSTQVIGIMIKYMPTWLRIFHIFTFCQISVLVLQFLFLPECNSTGLQISLVVISVIWWFIVIFGVICKRKIAIPPHIFDPLKAKSDFFTEIHLVLRSMGP